MEFKPLPSSSLSGLMEATTKLLVSSTCNKLGSEPKLVNSVMDSINTKVDPLKETTSAKTFVQKLAFVQKHEPKIYEKVLTESLTLDQQTELYNKMVDAIKDHHATEEHKITVVVAFLLAELVSIKCGISNKTGYTMSMISKLDNQTKSEMDAMIRNSFAEVFADFCKKRPELSLEQSHYELIRLAESCVVEFSTKFLNLPPMCNISVFNIWNQCKPFIVTLKSYLPLSPYLSDKCQLNI